MYLPKTFIRREIAVLNMGGSLGIVMQRVDHRIDWKLSKCRFR